MFIKGLFIGLIIGLGFVGSTAFALSTFMPVQGGTGTNTKPTYGQVLVGTAGGVYTPVATSSLGISSGTSGGSNWSFDTNYGYPVLTPSTTYKTWFKDTVYTSGTIYANDLFLNSLNSSIFNEYTVIQEPTGFPTTTDSRISFDSSSRIFTISPATSSYSYYISGKKYTTTTPAYITIPNTLGQLNFIYFNTDGNLEQSNNQNVFLDNCQISSVYWDTTMGVMGYDRHPLTMDKDTHKYLHTTVGTRYISGLSGTYANANTFTMTPGILADEDNIDNSPATTTDRIFYRNGAVFNFTTPTTSWYYYNTGNVYYDNAGTITPASANSYVAYWIFGTNDRATTLYSLMGQRQDINLANAQNNNTFASLTLGQLPLPEMKLLYRIIVRNSASPVMSDQSDYRTANQIGGSFTASDHALLSHLTWSTAGHTIDTNLNPLANNTYDLGSYGVAWRGLYASSTSYLNNIISNGTLNLGGRNSLSDVNTLAYFSTSTNTFAELNMQNLSNGASASTDFVATNNIGTVSTYYVNLGINSSGYADANYSISGPNDAYLYAQSNSLSIGTASTSPTSSLIFHTGGTTSNKERVRINGNGDFIFASTTKVSIGTSTLYLPNLLDALTVDGRINSTWSEILCEAPGSGALTVASYTTDTITVCGGQFMYDMVLDSSFVLKSNTFPPYATLRAGILAGNLTTEGGVFRTINSFLPTTSSPVMEAIVRLPLVSQTSTGTEFIVGFGNNALGANVTAMTQGIYFAVSSSPQISTPGSWKAVVKNASGSSETVLGVVSSTGNPVWIKLRIEVASTTPTGSGTATFFIDGVKKAIISNNFLPLVPMSPVIGTGFRNVGSPNVSDIDISNVKVWWKNIF